MNDIKFGSYNIETKEFQQGYIEDNKMKFRRLPWWKRLFQKEIAFDCPPKNKPLTKNIEYLGVAQITHISLFGRKTYIDVAVYRLFFEENNQTLQIFTKYNDETFYFNIDAWDKERKLVFQT